jgi:hypothetical protein
LSDDQPDDWRITNQESYLVDAVLFRRKYKQPSADWDHDHCEFCWVTFSEHEQPEVLREGYTTLDEYHWICPTCVEDFETRFRWTVIVEPPEV